MAHEQMLRELAERTAKAKAMGGPRKLAERKAQGILNARERLDLLFDPGSFLETGLHATAIRAEVRDRTPADGKIGGFGLIEGRQVAAVSNDFTVMGAASSVVNGKKVGFVKRIATENGLPIVFLGESTGARMPDNMGAADIGGRANPTQYLRMRESPWVSAVLGPCYGSSSWYAAMSDFVVMRKGAIMAVSSPKLTSVATNEVTDPEELGGWRLHTQTTGLVDLAVDSDEEAIAATRRFLSYLPSHHAEAPPLAEAVEDAGAAEALAGTLPQSRTQTYDVRRVLACIADPGSLFELKPRFGRAIVTALARIGGRPIGIVANNPIIKGGAIDVDACDKATSALVLCDSFNLPILFFVDQPGFLIGLEGERRRAPGRIMNWMNALTLCTVPKISVIMRKSYGQAFLNMGGQGNAPEAVAWTTAEVGFMDPHYGARIVHGVTLAEPERYAAAVAEMTRDTSAYDIAAAYGVQAVIDPRETREYLRGVLKVHGLGPDKGVGRHLMRAWPTSI